MENSNEEVIVEEVKNEKTKNKNILKSNIVIGIALVLLALIIGFSVGNLSREKQMNSKNVEGEVYSNIINTIASSNEELSIKDIAKFTENSVVEITTESVVRGSILGQYVAEGAGSGVVISEDGYIVTNNHVVDNANKIMIKFKNNEVAEAKVVGRSSEVDIAVIKVDKKNLQPAVLGDSSKLVVGDTAVVVGNPLGSGATVTNGIISAMDREIDLGDSVMNLLQTNAAVNPGNSGGGLFNGKGQLVGIIVAKSAGKDIEGIGFAIPINDIKESIMQIKEFGYIRGKVQLGVNLMEINNTWDAMMYGLDNLGIYVKSVEDGSDAQRSGVKVGDRIISLDGKLVATAENIKKILTTKKPGDNIKLGIVRNNKEYNINVILSEYKGK